MHRRAIWARNFRRFGLSERHVPSVDPPGSADGSLLQGDKDRRRRGRCDGVPEPGQAGTADRGVDGQQAVEPGLAVPGQDRGQPPVGLLLRPLSGGGDEALEVGDSRPLDPEAEQVLAGQPQEQGGTVVLQGAVHEPAFEPGQVAGRGLAEAEVRRISRRCSVRVCPRRPYRASSPGATSSCRATKTTIGSGAVLRSSGQKPRKRSAPIWMAKPRRLAGEAVPGICLRSARDRVKDLSRSPGTICVGKLSSRSRSASLRNPTGTAVSSEVAPPRVLSQTKVSEKAPMIRSRQRQIRAFRFSKTILGMDFSELYD